MSYNLIVKHKKLPRFSKNQGEFKEVPQYTIRGGYSSFIGGGTNNNISNYTSILGGPPNNFMIGNNTTINNNNTMVIGNTNNRLEVNDDGIIITRGDEVINVTEILHNINDVHNRRIIFKIPIGKPGNKFSIKRIFNKIIKYFKK